MRLRGVQPECQLGDDSQRSFRSDEEVLQVVPGIVLDQGAKPVPDPSIRQHNFHSEHLVACRAISKDVQTATICGDRAADGGSAACAPVRSENQFVFRHGFLQRLHDAPRLDGHSAALRVYFKNAVHPG